jgi:hypothetical protein
VRKPDGNRPFLRPRNGWVDNVEMYLTEIGWDGWTGLIRVRVETGGGLF